MKDFNFSFRNPELLNPDGSRKAYKRITKKAIIEYAQEKLKSELLTIASKEELDRALRRAKSKRV